MDINRMMRKHELIVHRLREIQEMERILEGKNSTYKRYMNDGIFMDGVRRRLEIEYDLLGDLCGEDE